MCTFFLLIPLQLSHHLDPGEYGLSLDTDVALWIAAREYDNKAPLRTFADFVIVNSSLHSEFDEFKKNTIEKGYSILLINPLLDYWNNIERVTPLPILKMYGKECLKLYYSDMDRLCEWVLKQREKLVNILYYDRIC